MFVYSFYAIYHDSTFTHSDSSSYYADPSGTYTAYLAKAIGSGSEGAQTELIEHYHKSMTLQEGKALALKVLKQVMEEKLSAQNVQISTVTMGDGFVIMSEEDVNAMIASQL